MTEQSFVFKALEFYGTRLGHRGQWAIHSKLREFFRANIDCNMEVERAGLRWVLNPSDYVHRNLFWLGEHDRWDTFHIKRFLPADAVVCDVGANFGYYSLSLAEYLKPNGRLFSVEPHPQTRAILERNIALNKLGGVITVIPNALSDAPGTVRMTRPNANTGAAYICREGDAEVEVTTLDRLFALHQWPRLDFLKIDVEGFEAHVLRGGEHCLKTLHPILLVELMPQQLERTGSTVTDVVSLIQGHGYRIYVSDRKHLRPLTKLPTDSQLINIFCLPKNHSEL